MLEAHSPPPVARAAGLGDGARRRPGPAAVAARSHALVAHLLLAAEGGLLEGHLEVPLDVPLVAPSDAEDAEQVPQDSVEGDVADIDDAPREGPPRAERRARLLGAVAEAVVHRAALRVGEDLVARVDLLEAERGSRVSLVLVGMMRRGEAAEGDLDLFLARCLVHSEDLVVVPMVPMVPMVPTFHARHCNDVTSTSPPHGLGSVLSTGD